MRAFNRPRPATHLRLESLEDRSVPSTFTVNNMLDEVTPGDGERSLREAIIAANAAPGADTIVLPAGVLKITLAGASENGNLTGDFDITDTVTIQGAGAGKTIIDGQQMDRVFDILGSSSSSIKVVFQGLTVRNGNVTGSGGGIQLRYADLVVRDCVVTGNRASGPGGGISIDSLLPPGTITLVRTTVGHNVAGTSGGGLYILGGSDVLTVNSSTLRRNVCSTFGGGLYASVATLTNSTVSDNSAGGGGGGISALVATLTGSTVSGNTTGSLGGGIYAGLATLTNSTVSGNSAGSDGGGIRATTATLLNCTVVENTALSGGGLFHNAGGTFSIRNTIVALNLVDFSGTGPDVSGGFASQGHNLIGTVSGGTGFGVNFDIIGTSANPIDPKLGALKNNGGRTKTHALLAGSPAIDHGDNAALPTTDQRGAGFPRKKDGNGDGIAVVDIGAFEK